MNLSSAQLTALQEKQEKKKQHSDKFELVSDMAWQEQVTDTALAFNNMGLHPKIVESITKGLKFGGPSQVQRALISTMISEPTRNILVGSQTGSGKTVAYLAPVMHFLKEEEDKVMAAHDKKLQSEIQILSGINSDGSLSIADAGLSTVRKLNRPRALILVPSKQLVHQVTSVAKTMGHFTKLRIVGIESKTKHVRELLASAPIDILVATPDTVTRLMKENDLALNRVSRVVMDEADTLFDLNFVKDTQKVLKPIQAHAEKTGNATPMVLVTATFPQTLNRLTSDIPDMIRLTTPSLHRTPTALHQQFLGMNQSVTKQNLLADVLKRAVSDTNRILVFCNTQITVDHVYDHLKSKNYPVYKAHSSMLSTDLSTSLTEFTKPVSPNPNTDVKILIATDLASRGLDTTDVGHVILFDFPHTVIDYMHRVGRTARFGRPGRATSFVGKRDLALAEGIKATLKGKNRMPSRI